MRARYAWIFICVSLLCQTAKADEQEDELPPLELLGYIADFSDGEEGWTDPESIDDLFSLEQREETETDSESDPGTSSGATGPAEESATSEKVQR
jgi:hypothetical protein